MEKIFILILFAIVFPAFWAGICFFLSHLGGWARLASHYTSAGDESGEAYSWRSARIGWVSYNSCLNFRICENGLGISIMFPFRLGHPPLFIPWTEFHNVTEKRLFFSHNIVSDIGKPVVAKVELPHFLGQHLQRSKKTYRKRSELRLSQLRKGL